MRMRSRRLKLILLLALLAMGALGWWLRPDVASWYAKTRLALASDDATRIPLIAQVLEHRRSRGDLNAITLTNVKTDLHLLDGELVDARVDMATDMIAAAVGCKTMLVGRDLSCRRIELDFDAATERLVAWKVSYENLDSVITKLLQSATTTSGARGSGSTP